MGDRNQLIFLQKFLPRTDGAILEIGSKDYGNTSSFRDMYPDNPYLGVDMEDGKGVDKVVDLAEGLGGLPEDHFGLTVCCSVLEHVAKPWKMAENITRLTARGGRLYISVPWVWRYHPYPDDYFRISFRGIQSLFPEFEWQTPYYSSNVIGEFFQITEENEGIDNAMAAHKPLDNGQARKYLPYLNVNMLGARK